jgi:hypothetical protein
MAKITQRLIFPEVFEKPIHCQFDEPHSSSDGGALLLKGADQKLQLTTALAACLVDARQTAKVKHTIADLWIRATSVAGMILPGTSLRLCVQYRRLRWSSPAAAQGLILKSGASKSRA